MLTRPPGASPASRISTGRLPASDWVQENVPEFSTSSASSIRASIAPRRDAQTHCGRGARTLPALKRCERCESEFRPKYRQQRFCSRACGARYPRRPGSHTRKVERPPHAQLLAELEATSYVAVGRKYGVSDNAVRKWVRAYARDSGA